MNIHLLGNRLQRQPLSQQPQAGLLPCLSRVAALKLALLPSPCLERRSQWAWPAGASPSVAAVHARPVYQPLVLPLSGGQQGASGWAGSGSPLLYRDLVDGTS